MEPFIIEEVSDSSSVKVIVVWIDRNCNNMLKMSISGTKTIVINIEEENNAEKFENIKFVLGSADLVFVLSDLGCVTEISALQLVSQITKALNIVTVITITKPFEAEGEKRLQIAEDNLKELKEENDSVIVVASDNILPKANQELSLKNKYKVINNIVLKALKGIIGIVVSSGVNDINLDIYDLKTVMQHKGIACFGLGEYEGHNSAYQAMKRAIDSLLLNDIFISQVTGILVHFKIHPDFPLMDIAETMEIIHENVHEDADVIFGTSTYSDLAENYIHVTIIATGFEEAYNKYFAFNNSNYKR